MQVNQAFIVQLLSRSRNGNLAETRLCQWYSMRFARSTFDAALAALIDAGMVERIAPLHEANGVDAYRYLTELFKALPYARSADDYEALLPWKLGQRTENTAAYFASQCKGVVKGPLTLRR